MMNTRNRGFTPIFENLVGHAVKLKPSLAPFPMRVGALLRTSRGNAQAVQ